jgi:hypothetical protein
MLWFNPDRNLRKLRKLRKRSGASAKNKSWRRGLVFACGVKGREIEPCQGKGGRFLKRKEKNVLIKSFGDFRTKKN